MMKTYLDMLTYRRPMGSRTERIFCDKFIASLPNAVRDEHGNYHVITDRASTILWSAHTDTVHSKEGRQTVHVDRDKLIVSLSKKSKRESSCLGADDTSGIYLLREMILAGVPGHFVFHYGEEHGGVGSRALAEYSPERLEGITSAIALDRSGKKDVITYQGGTRTASDNFALSLASALDLDYSPCSHGIYTDTAEYADLIPECTNLSVGYGGAHSTHEAQDLLHLSMLRDRLLAFDPSGLIIERDPAAQAQLEAYERENDLARWYAQRVYRSDHYADRWYAHTTHNRAYFARVERTEDCDLCGAEYVPLIDESYEEDHLCDYCQQVMKGHA